MTAAVRLAPCPRDATSSWDPPYSTVLPWLSVVASWLALTANETAAELDVEIATREKSAKHGRNDPFLSVPYV